MVNDGSPDNSWDIILEISAENPKVKGINLSRNFGSAFCYYCRIRLRKR